MSLYVLDTDVLTLLQEGNPSVLARVSAVAPGDMAITIISLEEMLSGWYSRIRRAKSDAQLLRAYMALQEAVRFAGSVRVLPFDVGALQRFRDLRSARVRIGTNDLRIASIALEYEAILVTRNL